MVPDWTSTVKAASDTNNRETLILSSITFPTRQCWSTVHSLTVLSLYTYSTPVRRHCGCEAVAIITVTFPNVRLISSAVALHPSKLHVAAVRPNHATVFYVSMVIDRRCYSPSAAALCKNSHQQEGWYQKNKKKKKKTLPVLLYSKKWSVPLYLRHHCVPLYIIYSNHWLLRWCVEV